MSEPTDAASGLSRRSMLKKSVVAGGIVWAAPTVLSNVASATTSGDCVGGIKSVGKTDSGITGCTVEQDPTARSTASTPTPSPTPTSRRSTPARSQAELRQLQPAGEALGDRHRRPELHDPQGLRQAGERPSAVPFAIACRREERHLLRRAVAHPVGAVLPGQLTPSM